MYTSIHHTIMKHHQHIKMLTRIQQHISYNIACLFDKIDGHHEHCKIQEQTKTINNRQQLHNLRKSRLEIGDRGSKSGERSL